jgi:hypothetical protein
MPLLSNKIINTREDLDALQGTQAYDDFMAALKGSMTRMEDKAEYPDNYGQPDYEGDPIEPVWVEVEDLSTITRFGFIKADFGG